MKNGRAAKPTSLDAERLAYLLECGCGLIPPAVKVAIRHRRKLVEHRTRKRSAWAMLQDAGIKADSVASSVTPKSGDGGAPDGERRPAVLADLARYALEDP